MVSQVMTSIDQDILIIRHNLVTTCDVTEHIMLSNSDQESLIIYSILLKPCTFLHFQYMYSVYPYLLLPSLPALTSAQDGLAPLQLSLMVLFPNIN